MPKANKQKKTKVIHPNSRAACQLAREVVRNERIDRRQKEKNMKLENLGKKLLWFRERLDSDKKTYSKQEIHYLSCQYMDRFADELEQIDIVNTLKGRSGFQHQARKDAIEITKEQERNGFTAQGLEVPDLMNGKVLQYLREWNGELRYAKNITMRKIKDKDGQVPDSKTSNAQDIEMGEDEESPNSESQETKSSSEIAQNNQSADTNEGETEPSCSPE